MGNQSYKTSCSYYLYSCLFCEKKNCKIFKLIKRPYLQYFLKMYVNSKYPWVNLFSPCQTNFQEQWRHQASQLTAPTQSLPGWISGTRCCVCPGGRLYQIERWEGRRASFPLRERSGDPFSRRRNHWRTWRRHKIWDRQYQADQSDFLLLPLFYRQFL